MDDKKVVFIICVNNELYFKECVYYINRLVLPEGYSTDIIAIRGADSMCAAYNAGKLFKKLWTMQMVSAGIVQL